MANSKQANQCFDKYPEELSQVNEIDCLSSDRCQRENESKDEISICWRNVRFETNECAQCISNRKAILLRLDGYFEYHTLNGLMGPSGAGKTTLLNCLSGNLRFGMNKDWEIYVNKKEHSVVSYWIEQHVHESIVGQLTVGDILRYAFRFKNGIQQNDLSMEHYIHKTMDELMLDEQVLNRCFETCSGGEQKRIAIAQELMSLQKPSLLFVDEPTTGLDSNAAFVVMNCLKKLSTNYRMTVIVSIHFPNDEILNLFDKLYVLAKGGVCIYSGSPRMLRTYLEDKIQFNLTEQQQPVEALLKIACNGIDDPNVVRMAERTLAEEYNTVTTRLSEVKYQPFGLSAKRKRFSFGDFLLHLFRLFRVTFIAEHRLFFFQIIVYFANLLLLASVFNHEMVKPNGCYSFENAENSTCQKELDRDALLTENMNYLCFLMLFIGFLMTCTSAVLFSPLVKVFRNEHRNQWYSLGVFYWSSTFVSLLHLSLIAIFFASCGYFLSEQHAVDDYQINWRRFGHFLFIVWLNALYSQSFGQLVGSVILDSEEVAIVLSQMCYTFMIMLNDFFFKVDEIGNVLFIHLSNLTALKFITRYMLYIFYGIDRCEDEKEFSLVLTKHSVDSDRIAEYIVRVLINVILIRLVTLMYLYYKFNTFADHPLVRLYSKGTILTPTQKKGPQPIEIDYNLASEIDLSICKQSSQIEIAKKQNEMQFEQFSRNKIIIAWRNLFLYASTSIFEISSTSFARQPKIILRNLNGEFRFGTLNALMGTSGSGKTSLLKVLNGRYKTRLNEDCKFYLSQFTKIQTCFITQEISGHLLPGLTAKQMLIYASRLKNRFDRMNSTIDHEKIALNWLNELNLTDTIDTKVDKCSGGERKRLALALELTSLQMPNLICIDEPISGLDSNSAEIVIACLHRITKRHNLTIIASIHQPNTEVLMMFDMLYVLANGGVCVFSGVPSEIKAHLSTVPDIPMTNAKFPIETLIKYSCCGFQDMVLQKLIQNVAFTRECELLEETQLVSDGVLRNRSRFSLYSVFVLFQRYLLYIKGHLWKEWLFYVALYLGYAFAMTIFFDSRIAIPTGCLNLEDDFNNTCNRSPAMIEEEKLLSTNFKYNFFMNNMFQFLILIHTSLNFGKEITYFINEHRNGWYSSGSFYLMKSLFETVWIIPVIMTYVAICNIYSDVRPGIYWHFVLTYTLSAIGFQGIAHIFSILSNGSIIILMIMSLATYLLFCLLGNFFISLQRLHYIYKFLSQFSIARFTFQAGILLEYGFGRCSSNEIQSIMYSMSIDDSQYYYSIWMLVINLFLARVAAFILLICKSNSMENRHRRVTRIIGHNRQLKPSRTIIAGLSSSDYQFCVKQFEL